MKNAKLITVIVLITLSLVLTACQPNWQIQVFNGSREVGQITKEDVAFYLEKSTEETEGVLLDQFLYNLGFTLIDEISFTLDNESEDSFIWDEIAEVTTLSENGAITIGDQTFTPTSLSITPSPLSTSIERSIMDIAPTIASSLGLPELPDAIGEVHTSFKAHHGVMILLDGTQYATMQTLISEGYLPFLQSIGEIQQGLTIYPPVTVASSASLLTGAPPKITKVYGHGYRSTETTTLFDIATEAGLSVTAIEGASLPFNLRNADTILSGDRDGNGWSDDNVYTNVIDVIETAMPDLLYIHFHEIDDMGHSYGPYSEEYKDAMIRVDSYLEGIISALPEDTLIAIFADHGMHETDDGGNHGALIASDLIIPIIFLEK
jgi:hypothetical protein